MKNGLPVVLVIDGQGGGIGKGIISALKKLGVNAEIVCAGTNPYAADKMYAMGADRSIFGIDVIAENLKVADIVAGPIGILIPNSLKGEISPRLASAVANAEAVKVLVPLNKCNILVAGVSADTLADNIEEAAKTIKRVIEV